MTTPSGFIRCSDCGGSGLESEHDGWSCDGDCCPSCSGSGLVPTEKLREEIADTLRRFVFEVGGITRIDCADAVLRKVAEHLGDRE